MKNGNVVVKQNCHFREFLSGIFNACRCQKGKQTSFNSCVEDPRLQISGMTPNLMGFTLIELLVVVLIIGILTAVALPQYQFAVQKARQMKVISLLNAMQQAEEVYYLAHGTYTTNLQELDIGKPITDITLYAGLSPTDAYVGAFHHKTQNLEFIFYLDNHPLSNYRGKRLCHVFNNDEMLKRVCQDITSRFF